MTDIDELKRLAERLRTHMYLADDPVAAADAIETLRAELDREKINRQTAELGYQISADTCVRLQEELKEMSQSAGSQYKKYILFQYDALYPSGGLGDISDSFDSLDEAQEYVRVGRHYDYGEVVDRDTWEVVWRKR